MTNPIARLHRAVLKARSRGFEPCRIAKLGIAPQGVRAEMDRRERAAGIAEKRSKGRTERSGWPPDARLPR